MLTYDSGIKFVFKTSGGGVAKSELAKIVMKQGANQQRRSEGWKTVRIDLEKGITFGQVSTSEDGVPLQVCLDMHVQDVQSMLGNATKQHTGKQ